MARMTNGTRRSRDALLSSVALLLPALAAAAEPVPRTLPVDPPALGMQAALVALTLVVLIFLGLLMTVIWRERRGPRPPRPRRFGYRRVGDESLHGGAARRTQ